MIDLHVILDIDQTLIDSMPSIIYQKYKDKIRKPDFYNENHCIWLRPKIKDFLYFLDKNVRFMSIWTNGTTGWLDHVVNNVLSTFIPRKRWYILSSINNSTPMEINNNRVFVKEVGKLLKLFPRNEISLKNTILIDDNFFNCKYNKYNSIPIKKFIILEEDKKKFIEFDYTTEILKLLKNSNDVSHTLKNVYDGINNYDKLFS